MDQEISDELKGSLLGCKNEKESTPQKQRNLNLEPNFASHTPQKTESDSDPLTLKSPNGDFEILQQRHLGITLLQLFDAMSCSLRLLALRKISPTFHNISRQVHVFTTRKFSYGHLAQLKYLLSEAIQIDKILVHNKKTLSMETDMKIMLLFNVVEGHHEQSDFIALHQLFISRLIDYFTTHPEPCDIPKATLPHPFNQCKEAAFGDEIGGIPEITSPKLSGQLSQTIAPEHSHENASIGDVPTTYVTGSEILSKSSHMHPSFTRHFSEKVVAEEKTQLLASPAPISSLTSCNTMNDDTANDDTEVVKTREFPDTSSEFVSETNLGTTCEHVKEPSGICPKSIDPLLIQKISSDLSLDANACTSPLCKLEPSENNFMIETPAQSTRIRGMPSSDDNHKTIASQKKPSSSKAAKRSLDFSLLEGDKPGCSEVLLENISHSSAQLQKVDEDDSCAAEDKACHSDIMHQQISNFLPGLVSAIHQIFHSINYSAITKEELFYKIIINSFDFDEIRQVEEQIEILEKLVPDWICRKLAPSGDALYSIKKMPDLNTVRSMVASI